MAGIATTFLILNNGRYAALQDLAPVLGCEPGVKPAGTDLPEIDFVKLPEAQRLCRKLLLGRTVDQIRYSGSEDFKLLGERWCRIGSVSQLSFTHNVNHFDPRQDCRGAGG